MLAPGEQGCGKGVPQGIEGGALSFKPGALKERLVLPVVEVVVIRRITDAVREDEARVSPGGGGQPLCALACPASSQGSNGGPIQGDDEPRRGQLNSLHYDGPASRPGYRGLLA